MISAECFWGPAPVAMLNTLSGLWELSALWWTRKWAKCLVILLINWSLQSLNCVSFQDSSLSQCLLSSLSRSLILLPIWRVKSGTRCTWLSIAGVLESSLWLMHQSAGALPAMKVDSGCLMLQARYNFGGCFFTQLNLEEFCTSVTFYHLLNSVQIGPKIPKLSPPIPDT